MSCRGNEPFRNHDMNRIEIPAGEIAYHPLSYADPTGRIFWWRNELYRGIAAEKAPLYQQLFHSGTAQRLIDKKLAVETEPTDYALDGYALILKHRALPFVSYPDEWCALM